MNKLSREDFNKLEKLVVVSGENYNQDRCLVIPVTIEDKEIEITMCMDELNSSARVCQVNGNDITPSDELVVIRALNELKKQMKTATYTKENEEEYMYYLDSIKMTSECCDKNCTSCFNCLVNE